MDAYLKELGYGVMFASLPQRAAGEVVLYATEDGQVPVFPARRGRHRRHRRFEPLFQTTAQNISLHVRNVLSEGNCWRRATVKDRTWTVQTEGKREVRRKCPVHNLGFIDPSRGLPVKSPRGTWFRQAGPPTHLRASTSSRGFVLTTSAEEPAWATRATTSTNCSSCIRDIASGRRMKARLPKARDDLCPGGGLCDDVPETTRFFQVIQNKLHAAAWPAAPDDPAAAPMPASPTWASPAPGRDAGHQGRRGGVQRTTCAAPRSGAEPHRRCSWLDHRRRPSAHPSRDLRMNDWRETSLNAFVDFQRAPRR